MPETLSVSPTRDPKVFTAESGERLTLPAGWTILPPGDAGLTRRVKASTATWTIEEKKGRKMFSRGVAADSAVIQRHRDALDSERKDPAYARKLEAGRARRDREQVAYVEDFTGAILDFLNFAQPWVSHAERMARAVAAHATPVGSGTVARTERIPIEERARAAVIAWMRHQTTAYDDMSIPRVAGLRRDVRKQLAAASRKLLDRHRRPELHSPPGCPLCEALVAVPTAPVVAPPPPIVRAPGPVGVWSGASSAPSAPSPAVGPKPAPSPAVGPKPAPSPAVAPKPAPSPAAVSRPLVAPVVVPAKPRGAWTSSTKK